MKGCNSRLMVYSPLITILVSKPPSTPLKDAVSRRLLMIISAGVVTGGGGPPPVLCISLLETENFALAPLCKLRYLFLTSLTVLKQIPTAFISSVIFCHILFFICVVTLLLCLPLRSSISLITLSVIIFVSSREKFVFLSLGSLLGASCRSLEVPLQPY